MVFQDPTAAFNPKMKIRDIVCEPLLNFDLIAEREKNQYIEILPGKIPSPLKVEPNHFVACHYPVE